MGKLKTRSEIKEEYKWDLSTIYKSIEKFEIDYKKCEQLVKTFLKHNETMIDDANSLFKMFKDKEEFEELYCKLAVYAHLKLSENLGDNSSIELYGRVDNLTDLIGKNTYFIIPNILKLDKNILDKWLIENENLALYKRMIEEIFRYKPHRLSEIEEKLMSELGKAFDGSADLYDTLSDSDMKFPMIKDSKGKKYELTDTTFRTYLISNDRILRKNAFDTLYNTYKQFGNTYAELQRNTVDLNATIAKVMNYPSALESSLFEDEVSLSVYDNLIKVVNDKIAVLHKYYKMEKTVLGIDDFTWYDTYLDLVKKENVKYPYKKGIELTFKALAVLGNEYKEILEKAFNEKWVDVYPNVGKAGGAFSGGGYYTKPFVLHNYQDDLRSVETLVHELGHSIHSYYTRNNNPYVYGDYTIFVAEVASTVNELLLIKYLINNATKRSDKLNYLNRFMELVKATIFRQTMFAEFEKIIYELNENGEVLTADLISNEYYKLVEKYFGKDVILPENIKYEWMRISHFHRSFYVYKYATGLSAACYIVNSILSGKEKAVENYIEFLKTGSRMAPLEELKIAGVDLNKKEVIESAINMFDDAIDEFKKTYEEYIRSGDGVNE